MELAHQLGGLNIRGVLFFVNLFLIAEQRGNVVTRLKYHGIGWKSQPDTLARVAGVSRKPRGVSPWKERENAIELS